MRTFLIFLVSAWASAASCERLFIGVLEADSYQSVLYGTSAFSRVAELPLALDWINTSLLDAFLVPSTECFSATKPFRLVQTVNPDEVRSAHNPATVAILPLEFDASSTLRLYRDAYASCTEAEPFTRCERPKATNLAPRVVLAISGNHLLTSVSDEALQWAWENRSRLLNAPPQNLPGTLRFLVNPRRLADLIGGRGAQAATFFDAEKILRDMESLSFALSFDSQALTVSACGRPRDGTLLSGLADGLRPPLATLWHGLPADAFFASVSGHARPRLWDPYAGGVPVRLFHPLGEDLPDDVPAGDRLSYLVATKNKKDLCWVQVETLRKVEPVAAALRNLESLKSDARIRLKREPARKKGELEIHSYALDFQNPETEAQGGKPEQSSTVFTVLSLFLKQAFLEAAVVNSNLVTVLGPRNAIDEQLEALTFREKPWTLRRQLLVQNAVLNERLCQAEEFKLAALLRHVVVAMPGVKPEHLRAFPLGGEGLAFGLSTGEDRSFSASAKLQTSEIAALQKINREGRVVLQELVFQLFSSQMLNIQDANTNAPAPARNAAE